MALAYMPKHGTPRPTDDAGEARPYIAASARCRASVFGVVHRTAAAAAVDPAPTVLATVDRSIRLRLLRPAALSFPFGLGVQAPTPTGARVINASQSAVLQGSRVRAPSLVVVVVVVAVTVVGEHRLDRLALMDPDELAGSPSPLTYVDAVPSLRPHPGRVSSPSGSPPRLRSTLVGRVPARSIGDRSAALGAVPPRAVSGSGSGHGTDLVGRGRLGVALGANQDTSR